ncbi:MAG: hypothetical protein R6W72_09245 [Desulfurivibrionaceae bacterium]
MKKIIVILTFLLVAGCASKEASHERWSKIKVSTAEEVAGCEYINEVDASRATLSDARMAARIISGRLGATDVVWKETTIQPVRIVNVNAKAYLCP